MTCQMHRYISDIIYLQYSDLDNLCRSYVNHLVYEKQMI